jgi:hypothetical protein
VSSERDDESVMELPRDVFRFGDAVLDVLNLKLTVAGEVRPLEPKSLRLLKFLVENRHRVVPKDEILAEVWEGVAVSDNALTRAVAQIRKALDDDPKQPRYIETVPTVGYRFVGQLVAPAQPLPAPLRDPPPTRRFPFRWTAAAALATLTLVSGGLWLASRSSRLPPKVVAIRQITKSPEADLWPSFSPDGSQIAFSSNRSGHYEIYVRSLAPDAAERQLTSDGQENIEPAWSPDGRYLAYAVRQHGGIKLIPVSGGPARYVTEIGSSPQWSPDGRTLAITLYNSDTIAPNLGSAPWSSAILALVDVGGGRPRPLIGGDRPPFNPASPRWLADGRHIVFISMTGKPTIWVVDSVTREPRQIHAGNSPRSPVFSVDSRHLYFADEAAKIQGIWRATTGRDWKVESLEPLIPLEGANPRGLTISADGSRLAFSREIGDSGIWSVSVDSHGTVGEPAPLIRERSRRNTDPHLSADGSKIAWVSSQEGGEAAVIYVSNADGSSPEAVTPADQRSGRPQWVGQDLTLAYQVDRNGEKSYWVAPLRGKPEQVHPALDLAHADRIRLSPDGTMMAAQVPAEKKKGLQVVVAGLRGGPARTLTPAGRDIGYPFWSPDGRWIGAEEMKYGDSTLVVIPSSGGEIRSLATAFRQNFPFDWSPDGDRIVFAGLDRGIWNIYWISFSTGKVEQLTHFTAQSGFVRYPSWSLKGDRILFERNDLTSNIYVADLSSPGK